MAEPDGRSKRVPRENGTDGGRGPVPPEDPSTPCDEATSCKPIELALLEALIAAFPNPALLVRHDLSVVCANDEGRAQWEGRRKGASRQEHVTGFSLTALDTSATVQHYLAIGQADSIERSRRLLAARDQWALNEKQVQVLAALLRGEANKEISTTVECSLRTVEAHMTMLLRRSGARTRTEVIASFWALDL